MSKSPLPEPVISDTPTSLLSAPSLSNPAPRSQNINRSMLASSIDSPVSTGNEPRKNASTELSVKSKAIEGLFGNRRIESAPNQTNLLTASFNPRGSRLHQLAQEMTYEVPFTQGQEPTLPPPVEKTVDRSEQIQQPSILEEPRVLQRPRPFQRQVRRLDTRPDYGWLIHDLKAKLERLKFYPPTARLNKWEGKVIVQMKILDDGHLIEAMVEESSGFDLLDQTALTIIRKASPLELDHPLLAANVILSVPLTFQLE
ncbi:MAG: energy transducer TonB [Nitrospirales bacterium]